MPYPQIAIANVDYSQKYDGENMQGYGYERYNFKRAPDGHFYGYVRYMGEGVAPRPVIREGWLVMFIARLTGPIQGLVPVGWYSNATFETEREDRPEYSIDGHFPLAPDGKRYSYCIKSNEAFLIPDQEDRTTFKFDNSANHIGSASIIYARGQLAHDNWREEFAAHIERIVREARCEIP
ncbi:hypothetical protein [uncultured Thiodictyon sp.]|uniref:hypothetical protein n=1 Tax=uncultured Thiodictyon sp. TaxID=1846217 RepID=UPI0025DF2230|nr:hypothetical protein [uncultured Thiodictyon sp.]